MVYWTPIWPSLVKKSGGSNNMSSVKLENTSLFSGKKNSHPDWPVNNCLTKNFFPILPWYKICNFLREFFWWNRDQKILTCRWVPHQILTFFSCFWSFWTNCPKKNFPQANFGYLSGLGVVCDIPKIQVKRMKKMTFFLMYFFSILNQSFSTNLHTYLIAKWVATMAMIGHVDRKLWTTFTPSG